MHVNDSTNVKHSILLECGLKVLKPNTETVANALFLLAERELIKKLEEKYSIKDIIDSTKGPEILSLFQEYFELDENYGAYTIYSSSFLRTKILNKNFIKKNSEQFKKVFGEYIDEGLSKNDLKKIPDAFRTFLARESIMSDSYENVYQMHQTRWDPLEDTCNGCSLRNNMKVRNMLGLWSEIKGTNLVTKEIREKEYVKILDYLKCYNHYITHYKYTYMIRAQELTYNTYVAFFKKLEEKHFATSEKEWQEILAILPTINDIKEGRKDDN